MIRRAPVANPLIHSARLLLRKFRCHRTIKRLLKRRNKILLALSGDIESTVALGETFCFVYALLTRPRVILDPIADDMDGQLKGSIVELLAKITGRPATCFFAISHHHDDTGLVTIIEHLSRLLDRRSQRCLSGRR
jgi:hypothetical protein